MRSSAYNILWDGKTIVRFIGFFRNSRGKTPKGAGTGRQISESHLLCNSNCATCILTCEGDSQARLFLGNWSDYEEDYKSRYGKDVKPTRVKYSTMKR
jgi:hypothetical protein